ncbi:MAG: anaerobic sulfatase-maturation protein [Prevotella sp.]|nr:anaerobic sulfatase-maturation protein [Prevotella sp.]
MILAPFSRPFSMMAKPVGARCNLACTYCYYLEKASLNKGGSVMDDKMLETFIRQYIEAQTVPFVQFTWHGGEPLMRNIRFFKLALELQKRYGGGRTIENSLQTNGTLLTDEWCEFLAENRFLVGISIDGPRHHHDAFRHTKRGLSTFDDVMRGIGLLNKHGVEWNALATVNSANVVEPREFYEFFREIGCQFLQFTPVVERRLKDDGGRMKADELSMLPGFDGSGELMPYSVQPEQWGRFLCEVFDLWVRRDVGTLFVQLFDTTLANWVGEMPGVCTMSTSCANSAVIEADGTVYDCDHFVFPQYRLGNLRNNTILELIYSSQHQQFARQKTDSLASQCKQCEWLFACNGECPRNRFLPDVDGRFTVNYLCEGYRQFFSHVAPYMKFMANEYRQKRPAANVMKLFE